MGSKAVNLRYLARLGRAVPVTFVCTADACVSCVTGHGDIAEELRGELDRFLADGRAYVVRSSGNLEDELSQSFAGQFLSVLGVSGLDNVVKAISDVCASAMSAELDSYIAKIGHRREDLRMAVIVQEMVEPVFSGVAFSKNPITGFDEVVVEAVAGRGDALVQSGATPMRWVSKWGEYRTRPADSGLPAEVIDEVVTGTKAIAKQRRRPVDLEWVYDGRQVWWVQLRDITTLGGLNVYSDKIAREMLPGQIKPLVWSVNIPLVNTAWVRFLTELIGPNDIDPLDLARAFHYRAYFNMSVVGRVFEALGMPRETLELMMGVESEGKEKPRFRPGGRAWRHVGRMLGFVSDKLSFGRRARRFVPAMRARYEGIQSRDLAGLGEAELLDLADELFRLTVDTAYYNVVGPLLMLVWERMLRSNLARLGIDAATVDVMHDVAELRDLNPQERLAELNRQFHALPAESREEITVARAGTRSPDVVRFHAAVDDFLRDFGHLSDSGTNFASVPWRENRELVLKMIINYAATERAVRPVPFQQLRIPLLRRPLARFLYRRARDHRLYREQIGSLYTFGYGLFRNIFLELGMRFTRSGRLRQREDILYLYLNEVRDAVAGGVEPAATQRLVEKRRVDMERHAGTRLPSIIFGDAPPPAYRDDQHRLQGTATSRGYYTGPVRVVRGLGDFDRVLPGDVLAVPFTDVGWTPLFAKAGAVISESGGILSHSSIIAREYGIPAVVSVPGACDLADGTIVAVDGFSGTIVVETDELEA